VEAIDRDDCAVDVTAGVVDGEGEEDVARRERERWILEGAVLDARADAERRKRLRPVRPFHPARHRHGPGGLDLREVVRVDRRHEREDVAERRARRLEGEIERDVRRACRDRPGEGERERVDAERVAGEGEALRLHVGVDVGVELETRLAQVRHAGELYGDGVCRRVRREHEAILAEVAAKRFIEADDARAQMRLPVVEAEARIGDLQVAQRDGDRAPGVLRGLGRAHDVPVRSAIGEHPEARGGPIEHDVAHDDPLATHHVAHDAAEVEHEARVRHREQRVAREGCIAHDREPLDAERRTGKVADEAQPDAAPRYARVDGLVDLGLQARHNAAAKEERQGDDRREQDGGDSAEADGELAESHDQVS
jgi:hypothetical protein